MNSKILKRFGKKAFMTILVALTMAFALAGCTSPQSTSSSASVTSASTSSASGLSKLVIIHTNDTHGYDQAADGVLGMAAVAQLKADYIAQGYDVLLFDVGDAFSGNLFADDSQGQVVTGLMNDCGYDAMTLGNHEFDYGADVLEKRLQEVNFPAVCANITVMLQANPLRSLIPCSRYRTGRRSACSALTRPKQ